MGPRVSEARVGRRRFRVGPGAGIRGVRGLRGGAGRRGGVDQRRAGGSGGREDDARGGGWVKRGRVEERGHEREEPASRSRRTVFFLVMTNPRNHGLKVADRGVRARKTDDAPLHFSSAAALFCRHRGFDAHSPFTLRRVHLPSPDPTWPPSVLFPRARTSAAAAFAAPAPSAPARCPPSPAPSTSPVLTWLTDPPMTSTSGAARSPSPSPRARPRCVKRLIRSDAPIANRFCPRIARLRGRVTRVRRCDHAKENP